MTTKGKRALIAVVRRVAFTGLAILGIWLLLIGLRGAIPQSTIDQMNEEIDWAEEGQRLDPDDWDWSRSLWHSKPVGEIVGEALGPAVQLMGLGALLSLAMAAVLLFLGVLISRVTELPPWLAQVRRVLRLVLVSSGVSTPVFMLGTLFMVFPLIWWGWQYKPPVHYEGITWWPVFFVSLLPAWLLVQAGHGEVNRWAGKQNGSYLALAGHLAIRLVISLLKMAGVIIVVAVVVGQVFAYPGWGRVFIGAIMTRDFPVIFGLAWVFALIVVLSFLAAELIEIVYNHFSKHSELPVNGQEKEAPQPAIPKGWLIFSLVLVFISLMIAFIGPFLAPYGYNEVNLADRLAPPSTEHLLGADNMGRDMLSRLLFGLRNTLATGLLSAGIMSVVAAGWATLAAHLRKANNWLGDTLEDLVMMPWNILGAFPWLILLLLIMSMASWEFWDELWHLTLITGLVLLPRAVGMMRETSNSPPSGKGWLYSVLWSILVMLLLTVAGGILYTSTQSYFGFGVPPPVPELGNMLSGSGRVYMVQAPWMVQWPAIFLVLLPFIWVMAGDALLERLGLRTKAVWVKAVG